MNSFIDLFILGGGIALFAGIALYAQAKSYQSRMEALKQALKDNDRAERDRFNPFA